MPASRFNKGPSRFSHKTRPHFKKHSFNSRGGRPAQKRVQQSFSDISKFVNKAVIIEEAPVFVPEHKFADFLIDSRLKQNIIQKGYTTPTPIQDRAIPHVLRGEDVVGIANTGTGKTAAFLIPLVNKILTVKGQRVLIMVPTRELALQINDELKGFAKGLGIYGVVCVGGANINPQISDLRRKPAIVIGTPGRLKDLLERRALHLGDFNTAVLDEADRMLDMGFIADMRKILSLLPTPRHTLFFSATLGTEIERLIGEFLRNPIRISVKTQETAANIDQDICQRCNSVLAANTDQLKSLLKGTQRLPSKGLGEAVAKRTILRTNTDGKLETWADVAHRVALGNSMLLPKKFAADQKEEYEILVKRIKKQMDEIP